MSEVIVVVREPGKLKPDYSLPFNLPGIPAEGDYLSITRPDTPEPWSEDLIVRKVWWRLAHSDTGAVGTGKAGSVTEIFVECDIAESPYSSDQWLKVVNTAREKGVDVHTFDVARLNIRQSDLAPGKV